MYFTLMDWLACYGLDTRPLMYVAAPRLPFFPGGGGGGGALVVAFLKADNKHNHRRDATVTFARVLVESQHVHSEASPPQQHASSWLTR